MQRERSIVVIRVDIAMVVDGMMINNNSPSP